MSVLDPPPFPPPSLPVVAPHWPLHTAQLLEHKRNGSAVSQAPGGAAPALLAVEHVCACVRACACDACQALHGQTLHVQTLHGQTHMDT